MRTFATNENNDWYINSRGYLAIITGLPAVVQSCEHASQVLLGELPYAQTRGIAFFENGLTDSPKLGLYQVQLRRILLSVPDVTKVESIGFRIDGDVLSYEATIRTIYGVEKLSGNL